jgi:hypothetical protein
MKFEVRECFQGLYATGGVERACGGCGGDLG